MRNEFVDTRATKTEVIAFWLVPAEPEVTFLRETIGRLARECDAPTFEPHLTLAVSQNFADGIEPLENLRATPLVLQVAEIASSNRYTKTLFIRCESNAELGSLVRAIAPGEPINPSFDPHVSLLYKNLPAVEAKKLVQTVSLPFSRIHFDLVKAVRCPVPVESHADVEAWKTISSKKLTRPLDS